MPATATRGQVVPWEGGQIRSQIIGSDTIPGYEATAIIENATKVALVSLFLSNFKI